MKLAVQDLMETTIKSKGRLTRQEADCERQESTKRFNLVQDIYLHLSIIGFLYLPGFLIP